MGTALKTVSMRLRKTKTEMEDAGEATDGMAETVSSLQAKLLALSHGKVNIMDGNNSYKSTVQILREMADAWTIMTDAEKAAALELMGGTRQGNTLSAILENFNVVENVIETSQNSAGSALQENAKYLDSIQGRIDLFNNALQQMWTNFINADVIKFFVDLGTSIVQTIDKIGVLGTVVIGTIGKTIISTLAKGTSQWIKWSAAIAAGDDILADSIAANGFLGASFTKLGTSIAATTKTLWAFLTTTPVGWALIAVAAIASVIAVYQSYKQAAKEAAENAQTQADQINENNKSLKDYKEQIKELRSELDSGNLSEEDAYNAREKLIEIQDELISKYGKEADGINLVTGAINDQAAAIDKLAIKSAKQWLADNNKGTGFRGLGKSTIQQARDVMESTKHSLTAITDLGDVESIFTSGLDRDEGLAAYAQWKQEFAAKVAELGGSLDIRNITNGFGLSKQFYDFNFDGQTTEQFEENVSELVAWINQTTADYAGQINLGAFAGKIQTGLDSVLGSDYETNKSNWNTYLEYTAMTAYTDAYAAILEAQDKLNEAMKSGDKDAILEANAELSQAIYDAKIEAENDEWQVKWFDGLDDQYEAAIKKINFKEAFEDSLNDISTGLKNAIQSATNQSGHTITDAELLNIGNMDLADTDIESYLAQMKYYADQYNTLVGYGTSGNVDYNKRPIIAPEKMQQYYPEFDGNDVATTYDQGYYASDKNGKQHAIIVTPILEDGTILDQNALDDYIDSLNPDDILGSDTQHLVIHTEVEGESDFWNGDEFDWEAFNDQLAPTKEAHASLYVEMDGLLPEQLALYQQLSAAAETYGMEVSDVIALLVEMGYIQGNVFSSNTSTATALGKSIELLTTEVENYSSALEAANTVYFDNMKVTEDYYNAIKEYIGSETELSECIDKNNGYIVTNSEKLQKLLKEKQKETKDNIRLAKSQARLKYYNLVKQYKNLVLSGKSVDASLLEQIDSVEYAIGRYESLEQQLLGTANAYKEFENAKEIDAETNYGDNLSDMLDAINEGIKTGLVGDKAFQVAIEYLVPKDVYETISDPIEQMQAKVNYLNGEFAPYYTVDDDSISITRENMMSYVADLQKAGLMTGTTFEEFDFVTGTSLDDIAAKLHITKEAAYALTAELSRYTIQGTNLLAQLDNSLEGQIYTETEKLKNATDEYYAYLRSGGDAASEQGKRLRAEMEASETALNNLGKTAADGASQYLVYEGQLADLEAQRQTATEAEKAAIDAQIAALQNKMEALGAPTALTVELATDYLDQEIEALQNELTNLEATVGVDDASYIATKEKLDTLMAQKTEILANFGTEGDEDVEAALERIEEFTIGDKTIKLSTSGYSTVKNQLQNILDLKNSINDTTVDVSTSGTKVSGVAGRISSGGGGGAGGFVNGTAHASGDWGLESNEHNSLVGELGTEIVVDPQTGRYYTVGDRGAEFVDLPKGAIIFNHKQSEALLKHGYVTSRGKAFAQGNAHVNTFISSGGLTGSKKSSSSGSSSTADNDDKQSIDFIEYKIEEIENIISKSTAKIENFLDNTTETLQKNNQYNALVDAEKSKVQTYLDAANLYTNKANELLEKIPSEYREMAKNGAIAIYDFIGETESANAEAIQEYREWAQKADEAENSYLESIAQISAYRLEQLQDIADDFENVIGLIESRSDMIQSGMDLITESGERLSAKYYQELIKNTQEKTTKLKKEKQELQAILDESVRIGEVQVGSDNWYEMVNAINDVDSSILECNKDIESFQNSINDLKWDNLDKFITQLDNVNSQISHLYDLLSDDEKVVDEFGNWTDEGVTSLGLLAQQMELAQYKSEQYGNAIGDLKRDYAAGLYSEDEYNEKLAELTENQWESIEAYESAKDALVSLNKVRVDAAKNAIQKEIDAYKELIDAKKESLDADKDAHDFEKTVAEKQKDIAKIQKQLAALANDNSAAAQAKKKQLQADLLDAQEDLEETYYDHSIDSQKDALDKEYDNYEKNKQDEMDALDEWLKDTDQVVSESLTRVQTNTEIVLNTIQSTAQTYGVSITEAITNPWKSGFDAISSYQGAFTAASDGFISELNKIKEVQNSLASNASTVATQMINSFNQAAQQIQSAYQQVNTIANSVSTGGTIGSVGTASSSSSSSGGSGSSSSGSSGSGSSYNSGVASLQSYLNSNFGAGLAVDGIRGSLTNAALANAKATCQSKINSASSKIDAMYNSGKISASNEKAWQEQINIYQKYLSYLNKYAKGTLGTKKDQLALIDELGEELVLNAGPDGRLQYLTKGTSVIPADLTQRLMDIALDPTSTLDASKPNISAPHLVNNNFEVNLEFGSLVHVDTCNQDTMPALQKMVRTEFDTMMKQLNNRLYSKVR